MKTRAELEAEAYWFDCEESEQLNHRTLAAALCSIVDDMKMGNREEDIRNWLAVTVDCFVPHEWTEQRRQWWAKHVTQLTLEAFDEDDELCHADGLELPKDAKEALHTAARAFIDVLAEHARPGMAREIGLFSVLSDEVIRIVREADPALLDWHP